MTRLILVGLIITIPTSAHAYFDPGTGSLLIQALIGGLAAITVFWGRVKLFLASLFSPSKPAASSLDGTEDDASGKVSSDAGD